MQSYKLPTKLLAVYYYKNKYTGLQGRRHRVVGAVAPPQNCTGLPDIYALCGLPNTYALSEQHHSFYLVNFLLWIPFGEFPFVNFLWRISFCEFPLVNSLWWIIPYGVSTPPTHTHPHISPLSTRTNPAHMVKSIFATQFLWFRILLSRSVHKKMFLQNDTKRHYVLLICFFYISFEAMIQ